MQNASQLPSLYCRSSLDEEPEIQEKPCGSQARPCSFSCGACLTVPKDFEVGACSSNKFLMLQQTQKSNRQEF